MEQELENNDFKRGNFHQQQMQSNNKHQTKLGYQIQRQQMNLSSMEQAATESDYTNLSSSRSQTRSESKHQNKSQRHHQKKYRKRSNSSSKRSYSKSSRSSSRSKSQKRRRTPSPWPQKSYPLKINKQNKKLTQGLSAIQQKTCKYWINGLCNQPQKCQYAHYKFGKLIQGHKKEFSNITNVNQQIREGQIMVKLSVFKLTNEEELKDLIRNNEDFIAKEIEISYQCSKQYKKMKKQINQVKKNKIASQNEKKASIREIAYDSIYHLQINNNEINAAKREEAQKKRKIKKEEKRVLNKVNRQNQQKIQENILNVIQQQINASNNLQYQSESEIEQEEENKSQQNDALLKQKVNKYINNINQPNNDANDYDELINQYSDNIERLSQQIINHEPNKADAEMPLEIQEKESDEKQNNLLNNQQEILINNYTQNNAASNPHNIQNKTNRFRQQQFQFLNNQPTIEEHNQKLNEFIKENSPKSLNSNMSKSKFQLFKELKIKVDRQQNSDLIQDANLLDSIQSVDSTLMKDMELKYSIEQLYDWKFICQQKLYTSSETQNVFNLQKIQKETYDPKQLIAYNSTTKELDMLKIDQSYKNTIKEQIQANINNEHIHNLIIVLNKNIAKQIFKQYTAQEIQQQIQEIEQRQDKEKMPGINDIHIFIKIMAQMTKKIVELNLSKENEQINLTEAKYIHLVAEYTMADKDAILIYEVSNKNDTYRIYALKQDDNPAPFFQKKNTFFQ